MSKRAALAKFLQDIRASYWFLPTILALFAILLAQGTLLFDRLGGVFGIALPETWQTTQTDGARSMLSVIATSIIGVAGVMFSLTLVAVSFAAGNFGPRLIGNFMRDRGTQWSLGVLVSTFVYALLVLRAVQSNPENAGQFDAFVPHLSVVVSLILTGVSIMAMIYYVHHIPETINVSNITASLGRRLARTLKDLIDSSADEDVDAVALPEREPDIALTLTGSGYIQTWNKSQLVSLAEDHDLILRVEHGAGAFVSEFTPVLSIWAQGDLTTEMKENLRDCFALGAVPTEPQNLLFFVQQLVEMIARALSPGVNDPFTAINGMNWIYVALATASQYEGGLQPTIQGRVHFQNLTLDAIVRKGIDDALPYLRDDMMARRHTTELLIKLIEESAGSQHEQVFRDAFARAEEAFGSG